MEGCESPIASPAGNTPHAGNTPSPGNAPVAGSTPPAINAPVADNIPLAVNTQVAANIPPAVNTQVADNIPLAVNTPVTGSTQPTVDLPSVGQALPTGDPVVKMLVERSPDPFAAVFHSDHEDRKPFGNSFRVRRRLESERPLYENGNLQMPPLLASSREHQLLGRSRLWGLWTDSVRLQRRIETLESAAECCVEQYSSTGWF